MSVLEMKGELHDLLAQVNEESHLQPCLTPAKTPESSLSDF